MKSKFSGFFIMMCMIAISVVLTLCPPAYSEPKQTAVIATVSPDWTSGSYSIASVDPVGGPRTVQNKLGNTKSDLTVTAYGKYFYIFERFGANNITKYSIEEPDKPIWQFSTEGDETNSNPYDLIFVNEKKAYLLRYGSDKAWIVNPSATTEASFKIGELDLSAYNDADVAPNMSSGAIVDNKLFITLQRSDLTVWPVTHDDPYVVVFDVSTDAEIDTQNCDCDQMGILISDIKNPTSIQYVADNDRIYVQGVGDWDCATDQDSGGIVQINLNTYQTSLVISDDAEYGVVSGMAIISPDKGYFVGYAGWGDNTLYSFDPSCGCSIKPVAGFKNISISGMDTGAYPDKNDRMWICNQTNVRVDIINTSTDKVDERISTELNPIKVVFAEGEPDIWDDGGGGGSGCFISSLQ
jgi:hypothetical protein